jgi:hypothetical protein
MRGDAMPDSITQNQSSLVGAVDALGDSQLANTFRMQAEKMEREASGLMAEAKRLLSEAAALEPAPVKVPAKRGPKPKSASIDATPTRTSKAKKVNVA